MGLVQLTEMDANGAPSVPRHPLELAQAKTQIDAPGLASFSHQISSSAHPQPLGSECCLPVPWAALSHRAQ